MLKRYFSNHFIRINMLLNQIGSTMMVRHLWKSEQRRSVSGSCCIFEKNTSNHNQHFLFSIIVRVIESTP